MLRTVIIGASGYTGAELSKMVSRHPHLELLGLYVSQHSLDANKLMSDLHPDLKGILDVPLRPLISPEMLAKRVDLVFLATEHQISHTLAPIFLKRDCSVFDLSGAFRMQSEAVYPSFYGFEHCHLGWLEKAAYGLPEWNAQKIVTSDLVALPGCYPTAVQLALKPLIETPLLDLSQYPVINAVSGISGMGRKAKMNNSFCEVSLSAYGLFHHRHQPEIESHLGCKVIFNPHIAPFKRGLLATITAKLRPLVSAQKIRLAFHQAYDDAPFVRLLEEGASVQLQAVQNTGFCDIGWALSSEYIVITSGIDNLLKGAASQAIECVNLRFGFQHTAGIL